MSIAVLRRNKTVVQGKLGLKEGRKEGRGREEGRRKVGRKRERRGEGLGVWGGRHQAKSPLLSRLLGGSDPPACSRHQIMTLPLLGFAHSCHQK